MKKLISAAFILTIIICSCSSNADNQNPTTVDTQSEIMDSALTKVKLEESLSYLKDFYFDTDKFSSAENFENALQLFDDAAANIKSVSELNIKDSGLLKMAANGKKALVAAQIKYLPKLRKSYAAFLKKSLWEKDIDVKYANNTLTFVGAYFAANANIKETQETMQPILYRMRFKQTNYKWFNMADEYTYYKIEAPKDGEIIK